MDMERHVAVRWGALLLLLCLMLSLVGGTLAEGENLLYNGDFSKLDEDGLPEGWFPDAYVLDDGYSEFTMREGDREDGSLVLEINNLGKNDARLAQFVDVEPESLYCLRGEVKAENVQGGHGVNLSVEDVYAFSEEYHDTNGEWVSIEYYGETGPEQNELTVFARVGGYSGVATGKGWFANLSLTKVDRVPGDGVADRWYTTKTAVQDDVDDEDYDDTAEETPGPAWPWLLLLGALWSGALIAAIRITRDGRQLPPAAPGGGILPVAMILLLSLALRLLLSCLIEGYMVDVNCFLSWGHTMSVYGPTGFYPNTGFCDYPPLYTYVLGLNALIRQGLNASDAVTRLIFRFVPSVCDVLGCLILYLTTRKRHLTGGRWITVIVMIMAFNPAFIINSAAWGQMDSVLCVTLLMTALWAMEGKWQQALPIYVVSVLIKPQALMLGPLGLIYIVLTWIREKTARRKILTGVGISLAVLAAGVIPFSIGQEPLWLVNLYAKTLASYPYATVNTANFYYLLGGNWQKVEERAHVLASLLPAAGCLGIGFFWYKKKEAVPHRWVEIVLSGAFGLWFVICAITGASWTWVGVGAMCCAFAIVLCFALRNGDIRALAYLGGLLFILLYVFGIKMHERYLFPAFLLILCAWMIHRDRRMLYLLALFTFTVFVNEGIVLDNSIRLGSSWGHLNQDTVFLADCLSVMNILGALYAVKVGYDLTYGRTPPPLGEAAPWLPIRVFAAARSPEDFKPDGSLHWSKKDTLILSAITVVFSVVSLLTLGSTKAPQTWWTSSTEEETIVFDMGQSYDQIAMLYFGQVSRENFLVADSEDGVLWSEDQEAQMAQGECWRWKYVTSWYTDGSGEQKYRNSDMSDVVYFSGRYIRLTADQLGLTLNEVIFRDGEGNRIPATVKERTGGNEESSLYSDPANLLDEQDTLEIAPAIFGGEYTQQGVAQPSWWNSTYFDEIYHARTAWEFLRGTTPYETTHPPLGKVLMSACVGLLGMTPFGWRFAGALAGILMLPGMYLLGKQLTKKTSIAALLCALMALDCQHLTQTQIATIDSFPVLFIIFAFFFMLRFMQLDLRKENGLRVLRNLAGSGFFMGLAIASKWIGIYAGLGLAVLFFWHCIRMLRMGWKVRQMVILCLWCILFFLVIPLAIYLLSYIPYMAYNHRIRDLGGYLKAVWDAQVGMLNYHSTPGLGMDHPYYSPWWEWPIIGKPMWYYSESFINEARGIHTVIFCFGNPVIWFGALGTLAVCLGRWIAGKRYRLETGGPLWHWQQQTFDVRYAFLFLGLLAQYLPWVLVPRGTYIYHYFASVPFLILSIGLALDDWGEKVQKWMRLAGWIIGVLALIAFILLFPYASGMPCPEWWMNVGKQLLKIWY